MRIRLMSCVLVLVLVVTGMASCSKTQEKINEMVNEVASSVAELVSGDVTGKIGTAYQTKWFEFTIHSIEKVDSYAGYEAAEGYQLYSVSITEKNIFESTIPMGTSDFYMDDPGFLEYIWPIDPLDDTMMPEEFNLEPGDSAKYTMIFEIPEDAPKLVLMYTEIDENDDVHATFTIKVK